MRRVRRIAHLSDVHLLDPKPPRTTSRYKLATGFVSLSRPLDVRARARKLYRAVRTAKAAGADHIVISGDLTEVGSDAEFEHFAEVLGSCDVDPDDVTLVPGNHDAYTTGDGWRRALAGPLARYRASSASETGKLVDRGGVVFLPVDTSQFQSIARSGGEFTREAFEAIDRRLSDPALRDVPPVLVLHHPPFGYGKNHVWQWIDGLRGFGRAIELLTRHPRLHVLHGHLHKVVDRIIGGLGKSRVFGAPATVDDREGVTPRVRLYDVHGGVLESVGLVAT